LFPESAHLQYQPTHPPAGFLIPIASVTKSLVKYLVDTNIDF
jgi:hypothetical protein